MSCIGKIVDENLLLMRQVSALITNLTYFLHFEFVTKVAAFIKAICYLCEKVLNH
jgi:hypothetical protein